MVDIWMDVDTAISEAPVNIVSLIDDTDFKTREETVVYNQAGMDLVWNFVTTAGAFTQTAVTPTTSGDYDWTNQLNGMYSIEIPASGGASINNDTEGHGWFTGFATGILPWRGPIIGFRAAALNNALIDGGDTLDVNLETIKTQTVTAAAGVTINPSVGAATIVPTNTQFEARSLVSADYTIVSDLGTVQTGDSYAIVNNGTYGNAQLVRSTTPANSLDISATGEAGLDFDNIKDATGAHTLTNITVPIVTTVGTCTTNTDLVTAVAVVNEWETQSQADPTGFHVNVLEVNGTTQTANDNGADISELQGDWTNGGRLDLILDSILALLDDPRGEPGDVAPPVNPDAMTKLDYLYKFLRNKIETTSTKIHVYDDAGTNKDHTSTISDDGSLFTRGEFGIGDA